jgi:phenylacetate-CoA ligase
VHQDDAEGARLSEPTGPARGERLSVIAPCLNEELNVPRLVERCLAVFDGLPIAAELVLIDDGSSDGTWAAINEAERVHAGRVVGARHETNRGIVQGWKTGLGAARGDLICLIDSDLQNRPEDITRLYEVYRSEHPDIVQAVRHPTAGSRRMLFSRALNHLLNLSFGTKLRDNKSGFVLCHKSVLEEALADADGYRYFQSFLGVAVSARGHRFSEIDTTFEARQAGQSFLSNVPIVVSLEICKELIRYRLDVKRRAN